MKKHVLLTLSLVCIHCFVFSQWTISADPVGGIPLEAKSYSGIKGTPYLLSDWSIGGVVLENGHNYDNLELLYDMLAGLLVFRDHMGHTKTFNTNVKSFFIYDSEQETDRNFIHVDELGFLEVLVDGNVPLYKKMVKSLVDEPASLGKVSNIKNVLTSESFYTRFEMEYVKLRQTPRAMGYLFPDGKAMAYIKKNRLNMKKEEDLITLFQAFRNL